MLVRKWSQVASHHFSLVQYNPGFPYFGNGLMYAMTPWYVVLSCFFKPFAPTDVSGLGRITMKRVSQGHRTAVQFVSIPVERCRSVSCCLNNLWAVVVRDQCTHWAVHRTWLAVPTSLIWWIWHVKIGWVIRHNGSTWRKELYRDPRKA